MVHQSPKELNLKEAFTMATKKKAKKKKKK